MNAVLTTSHPRSILACKEEFLGRLLKPLPADIQTFLVGGKAHLSLGENRDAWVELVGGDDEVDLEFTAVRFEIREKARVIYEQTIEFGEMYPLETVMLEETEVWADGFAREGIQPCIVAKVRYQVATKPTLHFWLLDHDCSVKPIELDPGMSLETWTAGFLDFLSFWRV